MQPVVDRDDALARCGAARIATVSGGDRTPNPGERSSAGEARGEGPVRPSRDVPDPPAACALQVGAAAVGGLPGHELVPGQQAPQVLHGGSDRGSECMHGPRVRRLGARPRAEDPDSAPNQARR